MNWKDTKAAIYRGSRGALKAVDEIDYVDLDSLVGLDRQKAALLENTEKFIKNEGANHALLWGERGCGKSSLAKAVFTKFIPQGLRIIEIGKEDLKALVDILDDIRSESFKFIIFCDDLSFEKGDDSYKYLKPLLEGSIEKTPSNVLMYATSNRRHIVTEYMSDNQSVEVTTDEIHYKDAVEEHLSLSDRFGLWISFYQGNFSEYLRIVDSYFSEFSGDRELLHEEAKRFCMLRGSRSGRVAKQFYLAFKDGF
ncbi:ATP-binding protein [Campylobacter geochelonis]|uniref:AAA ATPase family protein n=1 Tax=Campylobacter geochelonis TaxID=1780362 RepID=A0A128EH19_9BACT|nr:ATP-binding protein [Campylobacter geochelonis]QKF70988.1 ATP-binding protein (AAA, DUF815 domains) [Campylobacter geochelonis]CZE47105.1 AAA ATPase family protein [Campylobacter geochelonis]CZE47588.1 AAA ATPase family protein [Campylobacter geochelonis]CZE50196.1 AAA ATPase family protein [Campylobacter geochelonis]